MRGSRHLLLLALPLLFGLSLAQAGCSLWHLDIGVRTDDAAGLAEGDAVLLDGVRIGSVTGVTLEEGKPVILLRILHEHKARLMEGTKIRIRTPGLFSDDERPALVVEGTGKGVPLSSGARLDAVTRADLLLSGVREALGDILGRLADATDELGSDDPSELKALLEQARKTASEAAKLGSAATNRFREESLPKLEQEMRKLREELEAGGKDEEAKRVDKKIETLFESSK